MKKRAIMLYNTQILKHLCYEKIFVEYFNIKKVDWMVIVVKLKKHSNNSQVCRKVEYDENSE